VLHPRLSGKSALVTGLVRNQTRLVVCRRKAIKRAVVLEARYAGTGQCEVARDGEYFE
jgi:hypothetical protein